MRPHRARLVYSLVNSYGLGKQMSVYRPEPRSFDQLTEFHADGMQIESMIADQCHACVERVTIKLLELPIMAFTDLTWNCPSAHLQNISTSSRLSHPSMWRSSWLS